jgi:hypothetical protein
LGEDFFIFRKRSNKELRREFIFLKEIENNLPIII